MIHPQWEDDEDEMDDEEDDGMDNDMEDELDDSMEDIEEARKASESRNDAADTTEKIEVDGDDGSWVDTVKSGDLN